MTGFRNVRWLLAILPVGDMNLALFGHKDLTMTLTRGNQRVLDSRYNPVRHLRLTQCGLQYLTEKGLSLHAQSAAAEMFDYLCANSTVYAPSTAPRNTCRTMPSGHARAASASPSGASVTSEFSKRGAAEGGAMGDATDVADEERTEFWEHQNCINAASAILPSYTG